MLLKVSIIFYSGDDLVSKQMMLIYVRMSPHTSHNCTIRGEEHNGSYSQSGNREFSPTNERTELLASA